MIIIDGIIYSLQRHGGITVYFNQLIKRFKNYGELDSARVLLYKNAKANIKLLPSGYTIQPSRLAERYRACKLPVKPSIFHSSYYRLPDQDVPVITTVHDFTYERFFSGPRKWLHSWQKFAAIRASKAIICISESTRQDLFHYLPDVQPDKVYVVHNGVSDSYHPLDSNLTETTGARPYVLFVGSRQGYKNFRSLLIAMSFQSDMDLLCIGGGTVTKNESKIIKYYLGDRFIHHHLVSDHQLNSLYNGAFCFVYPSLYEGFGIPVLESMRAGCPVIAVNSSSIPEVAGDAALLVPEASPEGLSQAIMQLKKPQFRESLRQSGLQRALHFSWDRTFKETRKVYEIAHGS